MTRGSALLSALLCASCGHATLHTAPPPPAGARAQTLTTGLRTLDAPVYLAASARPEAETVTDGTVRIADYELGLFVADAPTTPVRVTPAAPLPAASVERVGGQSVWVMPLETGFVPADGRAYRVGVRYRGRFTSKASAAWVGQDDTTAGTYTGRYGAEGIVMPLLQPTTTPAVAVTAAGAESWIWGDLATKPTALLQPGSTTRMASAWFSASGFVIAVAANDALPHQVSLYVADFGSVPLARTERIDVVDAADPSVVLDSRTVAQFAGRWLTWTMTGNVVFRVTNTGPVNAVVSGVAVDPAGAGVAVVERTSDWTLTDDTLRFDAAGGVAGTGSFTLTQVDTGGASVTGPPSAPTRGWVTRGGA